MKTQHDTAPTAIYTLNKCFRRTQCSPASVRLAHAYPNKFNNHSILCGHFECKQNNSSLAFIAFKKSTVTKNSHLSAHNGRTSLKQLATALGQLTPASTKLADKNCVGYTMTMLLWYLGCYNPLTTDDKCTCHSTWLHVIHWYHLF